MVKVKIGSSEAKVFDRRANWIHEHLTNRQNEGQNVCVQVSIQSGDIDFVLMTPACGGGNKMGRELSPDEKQVFAEWKKHKLDANDFNSGNLVAFLQKVSKYC